MADFDKLLIMQPKNGNVYWGRSTINYEAEHYEAALVDVQKALELNPDDVKSLNQLAYVYMKLDRNEEALEVINKAITKEPKNGLIVDSRGEVYESMEKYEDALQEYKKALSLLPKDAAKDDVDEINMHIKRVQGKL